MSEERRRYQEKLQELLERATIRELNLIWIFTRAFLWKSEEVAG